MASTRSPRCSASTAPSRAVIVVDPRFLLGPITLIRRLPFTGVRIARTSRSYSSSGARRRASRRSAMSRPAGALVRAAGVGSPSPGGGPGRQDSMAAVTWAADGRAAGSGSRHRASTVRTACGKALTKSEGWSVWGSSRRDICPVPAAMRIAASE
jgi:hypothetical protein